MCKRAQHHLTRLVVRRTSTTVTIMGAKIKLKESKRFIKTKTESKFLYTLAEPVTPCTFYISCSDNEAVQFLSRFKQESFEENSCS